MITIEESPFPYIVRVSVPPIPRGGPVMTWEHNLRIYLRERYLEDHLWERSHFYEELSPGIFSWVQFRLRTIEQATEFKLVYREEDHGYQR